MLHQPLRGSYVRLLPRNAGKRAVSPPFACIQALLQCLFPLVRRGAPAEGARVSGIFPLVNQGSPKPCAGTKSIRLENQRFQGIWLCAVRVTVGILPQRERILHPCFGAIRPRTPPAGGESRRPGGGGSGAERRRCRHDIVLQLALCNGRGADSAPAGNRRTYRA